MSILFRFLCLGAILSFGCQKQDSVYQWKPSSSDIKNCIDYHVVPIFEDSFNMRIIEKTYNRKTGRGLLQIFGKPNKGYHTLSFPEYDTSFVYKTFEVGDSIYKTRNSKYISIKRNGLFVKDFDIYSICADSAWVVNRLCDHAK